MVGNNVSHANNKTKKRFLPNLHNRRLWHPTRKQFIRLRVSAQGLRLIDKYGIEAVLHAMETGAKIKKPAAMRAKAGEAQTPSTANDNQPQVNESAQEVNDQVNDQSDNQINDPGEIKNAR